MKEPPFGEMVGVETVVGGVVLLTVTVTPVLVVELPAESRAVAVRVWVELEAVVVFQTME